MLFENIKSNKDRFIVYVTFIFDFCIAGQEDKVIGVPRGQSMINSNSLTPILTQHACDKPKKGHHPLMFYFIPYMYSTSSLPQHMYA